MVRHLLKLADLSRVFGLVRSAGIAARWVFRREYLVLVRDLEGPLPEIPRHEPMAWTELTETDIPRLRALNPALGGDEIQQRRQEGQTCLLGWIGGELVYYRWDTTRPAYLPYLGLVFQPLAGDFLADETFTAPAFRGQGIDSVAVIGGLHRARTQGCTRSITLVAWWNAPSLRTSLHKSGRVAAGTVGYWTVGLGRRYFSTGGVRFDGQGRVYLAAVDQPVVSLPGSISSGRLNER